MLTTTSRTFTAQEIRQALTDIGFTPLVKIVNAEHWVRDARRVIVAWIGDLPEAAEVIDLSYATAIDRGDHIEISLH